MNKILKGVLLAGGTGSRLNPLTQITNKHLLPVYDKPMVHYALETLRAVGIVDVLLVSGRGHAGHFLDLLGSGKEFGLRLSYEVQEEAGGIAQALGLAKDFSRGQNIAVILGDNIFMRSDELRDGIAGFADAQRGARLFLKRVPDASRFGVAEIQRENIVSIEEKPKNPKSDLAATGIYILTPKIFNYYHKKQEGGGEYYLTEVIKNYLKDYRCYAVKSDFWIPIGYPEDLVRAEKILNKLSASGKNAIL